MSFDYTRPSGTWPPETVPGASDFQRFDYKQSVSLNGDLGGTCAPSKLPITIGGAGLSTDASGSSCTGGVATATGGRIKIAASAGDFPQFSASRGRTIRVPVMCGAFDSGFPDIYDEAFSLIMDDATGWGVAGLGLGINQTLYFDLPKRYMHVGARIATLTLEYVCTKLPSALPTNSMVILPGGANNLGSASQFFGPAIFAGAVAWQPSHAYPVGTYMLPATQGANTGFLMEATAISGSGTSGTNEPGTAGGPTSWPTAIGGTVIDNPGANQITWTAIARSGWLGLFGQTPETYYGGGAPQTLSIDYIGTSGSGYSNIIAVNTRYELAVTNIDPTFLLTGIILTYDSISSMAFE